MKLIKPRKLMYTGDKLWNAPLDFFELFGEEKALAQALWLKPYQLIDVQRLPDEALKARLWSGLVEFVLKYRRVQDFAHYLETLLPWLRAIETQAGAPYAKIVLRYVLSDIDAEDEQLFIEKADEYLSNELRGEVMTLAQRFEQRGIEKGMQQGEYSLLLRQLERKFKVVPEHYRHRLAQADANLLLAWGERALEASTLKELFAEEN